MIKNGLFALIPCKKCVSVITVNPIESYQILYCGMSIGNISVKGELLYKYPNAFNDEWFIKNNIIQDAIEVVKGLI